MSIPCGYWTNTYYVSNYSNWSHPISLQTMLMRRSKQGCEMFQPDIFRPWTKDSPLMQHVSSGSWSNQFNSDVVVTIGGFYSQFHPWKPPLSKDNIYIYTYVHIYDMICFSSLEFCLYIDCVFYLRWFTQVPNQKPKKSEFALGQVGYGRRVNPNSNNFRGRESQRGRYLEDHPRDDPVTLR